MSLNTNRKTIISVIGLGYVGLPIALAFSKKYPVVGFDINEGRIARMKSGQDPSGEIDFADFPDADIQFTANAEDLRKANFHIVAYYKKYKIIHFHI
jgi:UDP-N-acetyl-D-galactosamine dehydrogenase